MNGHALIALLLCGSFVMIESNDPISALTFAKKVIAVKAAVKVGDVTGVGPATVGALAVIMGVLLGNSNRNKRSLSAQEQEEAVEAALHVAQQVDEHGCVSKLLCELGALPENQLSQAGRILKDAFGNPNVLHFHDAESAHMVYDLDFSYGVKFGKIYPKICDQDFNKCQLPSEDLFDLLESQFTC